MRYKTLILIIFVLFSCSEKESLNQNYNLLFKCVNTGIEKRANKSYGLENFNFVNTMNDIEKKFLEKNILKGTDKDSYKKFAIDFETNKYHIFKIMKENFPESVFQMLTNFYGINNDIGLCYRKFSEKNKELPDVNKFFDAYNTLSNLKRQEISAGLTKIIDSYDKENFKDERKRAIILYFIYSQSVRMDVLKELKNDDLPPK
jgi:hypothetical protein